MPINKKIVRQPVSYWLANSCLIVMFLAGGWLGNQTAILPEWPHIIWPPTGIALAVLLFGGYKFLPGVILGAFGIQFIHSHAVIPALIAGLSSGGAASAGTFLLQAFGFQNNLSRIVDVYRLILFGGLVATLINATLDTAGLLLTSSDFLPIYGIYWLHSWQSHLLGVLVITPLLLTWLNHPPTHLAFPKGAEAFVIMAVMSVVMLIADETGAGQIAYLPFPFLVWAAFRLERRGTLLISAMIIAVSFLVINLDESQFLVNVPYSVWVFMCAVGVTAVTLPVAIYERQQIASRLQAERDFAQQVMKQLGQGITITGLDHRFQFVNKAFAQMVGFEPEELIGHFPNEVSFSEDAPLSENTFEVRQNRETTTYEARLRHRNGRHVHVLITSVPRILNNQIIGAITVITNLTDRHKSEQKLRQSEQNYKQLFSSTQRQTQELGLLARLNAALARELNLSTIYATVVDALADTFGYDQVSLYIRRGTQLILQHQRGFTHVHRLFPINSGIIGRVVRTGETAFVNNTQFDQDYISVLNEDVTHAEICVPLYNETAIVGALNIESKHLYAFSDNDINLLTMLSEHVSIAIARAHLYAKVAHNEKRFRALIEHNPATITLVDETGNHKPINTTVSSPNMQIQKNIFDPDAIHPNDLEEVQTIFHALLKTPGQSKNITHRIQTKDGKTQWVEKTFTNLLDDLAVQAVVINARDITERKQAEEALLQAQKLESLGILAGGIAHDFNNLLVAMMGQISLAQLKGQKDSPVQTHLQKAYTATERAGMLTRQLLAYSGHGQFQIETINLNHLITDNLHLFTVGLPKTVQFASDLYEPLPLVKVDVGQMQQVIMNLIINGAEAIGDRSGTVKITTSVSEISPRAIQSWPPFGILPAPGHYVTLSVADNGVGMNEETLVKIFDPFFTTKFTGRGLGLAAVQGIIRGHNGGLTVYSAPDQGSRFDLLFPVEDVVPTKKIMKEKPVVYHALPAQPSPRSNHKAEETNGMILVVDDEATVRDTFSDILLSESLQVITAVNGHDGIQQFQQWQHKIKLIILDLSMPGISIEEVISQLRHIRSHIPIVVSSGYGEIEVNQRLDKLDVAGFLQKPYDVDQLITTIRHQLASIQN